jgi:hypothetical protein
MVWFVGAVLWARCGKMQSAFSGSPLVGSSQLGDAILLEGANLFPRDLSGVRGAQQPVDVPCRAC